MFKCEFFVRRSKRPGHEISIGRFIAKPSKVQVVLGGKKSKSIT